MTMIGGGGQTRAGDDRGRRWRRARYGAAPPTSRVAAAIAMRRPTAALDPGDLCGPPVRDHRAGPGLPGRGATPRATPPNHQDHQSEVSTGFRGLTHRACSRFVVVLVDSMSATVGSGCEGGMNAVCGSDASIGRRRVKVAPPLGVAAALTCPPCARTSSSTTARPTPDPPARGPRPPSHLCHARPRRGSGLPRGLRRLTRPSFPRATACRSSVVPRGPHEWRPGVCCVWVYPKSWLGVASIAATTRRACSAVAC